MTFRIIATAVLVLALGVGGRAYAENLYVCVDEATKKKTMSDRPCGSMTTEKHIAYKPDAARSENARATNKTGRLEDDCPPGVLNEVCRNDMRNRQKEIDRMDKNIEDLRRQKEKEMAEIRSRGR